MGESHFGVRMAGPLALHADGFREWLIEPWYSPVTAVGQLRLMAHLGRWLTSEGVDCLALTDEVAAEFLRARRAEGYRNLVSRPGWHRCCDTCASSGSSRTGSGRTGHADGAAA